MCDYCLRQFYEWINLKPLIFECNEYDWYKSYNKLMILMTSYIHFFKGRWAALGYLSLRKRINIGKQIINEI